MKSVSITLILIFLSGCTIIHKNEEPTYKVSMEISEDGVIKSRPTTILNGSERSSVFLEGDRDEGVMEFQVVEVKNGVYHLNTVFCNDVSDLLEEDLLKPLDCESVIKTKIMGRINQNALVVEKKNDVLKKVRVNVSIVDEDDLLEDF